MAGDAPRPELSQRERPLSKSMEWNISLDGPFVPLVRVAHTQILVITDTAALSHAGFGG